MTGRPAVLHVPPPKRPFQTLLWNICPDKYRDKPLYFGKEANHRFDSLARLYGTLYGSPDLTTALLESVLHDRSLTKPADRVLTRTFLAKWFVKPIYVRTAIQLANLSAPYALANLGYDNSVLTNRGRYVKSQALSHDLHHSIPDFDGLIWNSRQGGSTDCIVLFDRCRAKLRHDPPDIALLVHPHFKKVVADLHLRVL